MKKTIMIFMVLALSSCASTPDEVLKGGSHFEYLSQKNTKHAAECLSRASRNLAPNLVSVIQDGEEKNTYEVIVNSTRGDGGTIFIFDCSPSIKETKIDAYVSSSIWVSAGKEKLVANISGQCK